MANKGVNTNAQKNQKKQLINSVSNTKNTSTTNNSSSLVGQVTGNTLTTREPMTTTSLSDALGYQAPTISNNNAVATTSKTSLQDALTQAAKEALTGNNGPYIEGPNLGTTPYQTMVNPTTVYSDPNYSGSMAGNNSLYEALTNKSNGSGTDAKNSIAGPEGISKYTPETNKAQGTAETKEALSNAISGFSNTNNNTNVNPNAGGSRGTSGSGSAASSVGLGGLPDYSSLYDLLEAQLNEYDNGYNALMQSLRDAYDRNNATLDSNYTSLLNLLRSSLAESEGALKNRYTVSQEQLDRNRRRALQEAYISQMMGKKNLAEQLDAYGLTGGATETMLGRLINNYLNNRNQIESDNMTSLEKLLQDYDQNLANVRTGYNNNLANLLNSRMSATQNLINSLAQSEANAADRRANARASAYESLYNTLAKLMING